MKRQIVTVCLAALLPSATGCSGWRYGQTEGRALNRYLLVSDDKKAFGNRRLKYIEDFRSTIKGFVEYHGPPDFFYEFKTAEGRAGVRMYYVRQNLVYLFLERNWMPDSIFFAEQRQMTAAEAEIYAHLIDNRNVENVEPDGPANRSQPSGVQTNRTSVPAGSGR